MRVVGTAEEKTGMTQKTEVKRNKLGRQEKALGGSIHEGIDEVKSMLK